MVPTKGIMPLTTDAQAVRDYVASFEPSGGTAAHIGAAWGLYALTPEWGDLFDHPAGDPVEWNSETDKFLVIMTDGQFNSQKDPNMNTTELYKYFQSVCTKARDNGVRIYTIGLLLDSATDAVMSECAGNTGKYFPVDNRLELRAAFGAVGGETGELRLSH